MRAPLITIRCECAAVGRVPYGEVWKCERCGRRWSTAQIPEGDYQAILDALRWFKIAAFGGILVIGAVFVALALLVATRLLLLLPVAVGVWYTWFWPRRRKELRERARALPTWNLRPSSSPDVAGPSVSGPQGPGRARGG